MAPDGPPHRDRPSTRVSSSPRSRPIIPSLPRAADLWTFTLATRTWTLLTPTGSFRPLPRCMHAAVALGTHMLVTGGLLGPPPTPLAAVSAGATAGLSSSPPPPALPPSVMGSGQADEGGALSQQQPLPPPPGPRPSLHRRDRDSMPRWMGIAQDACMFWIADMDTGEVRICCRRALSLLCTMGGKVMKEKERDACLATSSHARMAALRCPLNFPNHLT